MNSTDSGISSQRSNWLRSVACGPGCALTPRPLVRSASCARSRVGSTRSRSAAPFGPRLGCASPAALAPRPPLRSLVLVKQVTHPAHRADLDAERLELAAYAMHVDLDRIAADVVAEAEQVIDHLLLAHHAALAREQQLGERELARRHLDGLIVVEQAPCRDVEPQPPVNDAPALHAVAAPDQRAHTRLELRQVERLGHVVVGAEIEAGDAVLERVARG